MKSKTKNYILLTILLLFSLLIVSCDSKGDGKSEDETTQPAATVEATKASGASGEPSGAGGIFANPQESLDSYRMRTEMTLVEGEGMLGEKMITEIEWVRDPEAEHLTMFDESDQVMMETITIGDDTWTSMDGETWIHSVATPEEAAMPGNFQASLEDLMQDMEGGMKKDGTEKVNDVDCIRYTVDADFALAIPAPEDAPAESLQFMPTEMAGHIEGSMWVADERNLPEVIVRSDTRQEITLKYASREETMVYDELRDMYDINEPISIEPPDGQVQEMPTMPTMPADLPTPPAADDQPQPPAGEPVGSITYAELNELDSYHLEWTVTVKTGDGEAASGYTVDWTRDPLATHLSMSMGAGMPPMEYIWANDTVWVKVPGGDWMLGSKEDMDNAINQVGDVLRPEDDMVLVGEETVNGVHCQHYAKQTTTMGSVRQDIWVADQDGLPPVVIRGINQTEVSGITTTIDVNVTAINEPVTIEPPQ
ncbi:MAG: hypothetical protein ACOYZ7_19655 [Chloroflexota bacterium]